jgi:transcriptional regulator with XRE-family HTH domain
MIYYKIKEIRTLKKLSVQFLALELQVSLGNYIAIENGETDIKMSKLFRIAEILGVLVNDLFYYTETKPIEDESYNLLGTSYTSYSDK